jgi:hypothetical protein
MHAGWGPETFGALNVVPGEYDAPLYYQVTLGIPVYVSFRGCFHFIDAEAIVEPGRAQRIAAFAVNFALEVTAIEVLGRHKILIPLRLSSKLRWMARAYALLSLLLLGAICAPVVTFPIWKSGRVLRPGEAAFMAVAGSASFCSSPARSGTCALVVRVRGIARSVSASPILSVRIPILQDGSRHWRNGSPPYATTATTPGCC